MLYHAYPQVVQELNPILLYLRHFGPPLTNPSSPTNIATLHAGPPRHDPADECSADFLVRVVSILPSNSTIFIKEKTYAKALERRLVYNLF